MATLKELLREMSVIVREYAQKGMQPRWVIDVYTFGEFWEETKPKTITEYSNQHPPHSLGTFSPDGARHVVELFRVPCRCDHLLPGMGAVITCPGEPEIWLNTNTMQLDRQQMHPQFDFLERNKLDPETQMVFLLETGDGDTRTFMLNHSNAEHVTVYLLDRHSWELSRITPREIRHYQRVSAGKAWTFEPWELAQVESVKDGIVSLSEPPSKGKAVEIYYSVKDGEPPA